MRHARSCLWALLVCGAAQQATVQSCDCCASCGGCGGALEAACGTHKGNVFECAQCAGANQHELQQSGCNNGYISAWCAGQPPPPPSPPGPTPGAGNPFPGSEILTDPQLGRTLSTWMGATAPTGGAFELCYSSSMDRTTSPADFHQQCDHFNTTVTVVHNSAYNYTFGGVVSTKSLLSRSFGRRRCSSCCSSCVIRI